MTVRSKKRAPKIVVVMPAYNAGSTLRMTYEELPKDAVNLVILVDDGSTDTTLEVARDLGLEIFVHDRNYGCGANQKTCYTEALKAGADIVVMVHPDYQYDPTLVPQIIAPIVKGDADLGRLLLVRAQDPLGGGPLPAPPLGDQAIEAARLDRASVPPLPVIARLLAVAAAVAAAGLGVALVLWTGRREHWPWRPEHFFLLTLGLLALRVWLAPRPLPAWRPRPAVAGGAAAYALVFSFVPLPRHFPVAP